MMATGKNDPTAHRNQHQRTRSDNTYGRAKETSRYDRSEKELSVDALGAVFQVVSAETSASKPMRSREQRSFIQPDSC